ncbi:cytochrome c-type biogenesis protein [Aliamphritea spongicola]
MTLRACFIGLLVLISQSGYAAIDTYEFKDDLTRERFQALSAELRCPKCQNQNIADSNSPIAKDLRDELYRMLDSGASDTAIVDFMVTRYGEFVLYRPRVSSQTYLLWYAPAGLLSSV